MRPRAILLMLLATTACTIKSGPKTTPINDSLMQAQQIVPQQGARKPQAANRNRGELPPIRPTPDAMDGNTWVIDNFDPNRSYEVPTRLQRSTMLKLCDGEMFNGNPAGGNVEDYMVTASYAGSRPALSVTPRLPGARTNLQITTSGDAVYNFDLVTRARGVTMVEIRCGGQSTGSHGVAEGEPQMPQGATVLILSTPDGSALPAWKPLRAWADADRLVITFPAPQPQLPTFLAGHNGEQIVRYDVLQGVGTTSIVTKIRVTEAQLRIGDEVIDITAAQPEPKHDWRQAGTLEQAPGAVQPVIVIMPQDLRNDSVVPVSVPGI